MRAFRPQVADLNEQAAPQVVLDVEIPGLCVRRSVVRIDRIGIGDGTGHGGDKASGERQHVFGTGIDIVRGSEGRLLRKTRCKRIVGLAVVVNSVTGSHNGRTFDPGHFPGQPKTR